MARPLAALLVLAGCGLTSSSVDAAGGACRTAADCALNGRCEQGRCMCEPAWCGSAACSQLRFTPTPRATGYRHHAPYLTPNSSSWGGGGFYDNHSGLFLLWVSEMAGQHFGYVFWSFAIETVAPNFCCHAHIKLLKAILNMTVI